jgi:putative hydrolase of the HAD superfamily
MVRGSNKIKYISFDLDGTLVDTSKFEEVFWDEEIPRIYSEEHGIPLDDARKIVFQAYRELNRENIDWYKPAYWFKRFKLKRDWRTVIKSLKHHIKTYPEVNEVLKSLSKNFKLIILTHSSIESTLLKIERNSIGRFFSRIFSTIDDFNLIKRDESVYRSLLRILKIRSSEIIHMGDDYEFDYRIPRKIGIRSILIDRSGKRKGKDIIHDLKEIENIL